MGASGKAPSFTPTSYSALDPASQGRRDHLYNQAQEYAATNPYSQRYGGNVTGMTPMGMAGQQFMTNRMMGPGAYQAQNLGFQNYQPSFTYSPMAGGGGGQPPFTPPGQPPVQPPAIDPMATTAPTVAPPTVGDATVGSPGGVGTDQANVVGAVADASIPTATTFGPPPTNQAEIDARAAAMEAEGRRQRGVDTAATAGVPEFSDQRTPQGMPMDTKQSAASSPKEMGAVMRQPPDSISIDGGVDMLGNPLAPPDPNRMAVIGGGGEGERSVFSDEFGGQGTPQGMPLDTRLRAVPSPEEMGAVMQQPQGLASREDYTPSSIDGRGMQQQPPGFSDEFGGGLMGMTATTPEERARIEQMAMNMPIVDEQRPPMTQQQQIQAAIGLDASDPTSTAVAQQQIPGGQPDLGFGGPQMDTMTPPGGQPQGPPADGEQFTPASISGIESVLDQTDPTVTAASALGRPKGEGVSAYMDATGVDAQIASAQQDYEEQLAALQAQQAGSGAFGSRGDLQDMGAMGEHLRNIGNIRAAGFDKAATRMDADLAREQQAALEQARLQQNLTGQQLTAAQALGREERAIGQEFRDMGADQRRIMEQQRIFDEEQWRRTMEGPGRELAMVRGYLPPDIRQQMVRDPSGTQKALSLAGGVGSLLGGPVGGLLGKGLGALGGLFGGGNKGGGSYL